MNKELYDELMMPDRIVTCHCELNYLDMQVCVDCQPIPINEILEDKK